MHPDMSKAIMNDRARRMQEEAKAAAQAAAQAAKAKGRRK